MAVFHQMGHHSNNLVDLPEMVSYAGAIFSPVNCTEAGATTQIQQVRATRGELEVVLDPQLYVPKSEHRNLKKWRYFPKEVDSSELNSLEWWSNLNEGLLGASKTIGVDSICSPAVIPKVFDDKYYAHFVKVGNELTKTSKAAGLRVLQTVVVSLADLAAASRGLEVASIVSRTEADRIYLVLVGNTAPRRELSQVDELHGAMELINALERNQIPVLVAFCSSDLLLWKFAGATSCASGKFFNLRRFTPQRFEEPGESGGGQLPYWFEEGLLAFLRQGDLLQARKLNLMSAASGQNPFAQQILGILHEAAKTHSLPKAWLGISWRMFLYWFADVEGRLARNEVTAEDLLNTADANWAKLEDSRILMEERHNDGAWVRDWLNALHEYERERVPRSPERIGGARQG